MDEFCKEDFCGKQFHFREVGTQREIIVLSRLLERGLNLTYIFTFRSLRLLKLLFRQREGSFRFIRKEHDSSWLIYRDGFWFSPLLQIRLRWGYASKDVHSDHVLETLGFSLSHKTRSIQLDYFSGRRVLRLFSKIEIGNYLLEKPI